MTRFPLVAGLVVLLSLTIGAGVTMAGRQFKWQSGKLSVDGWQLSSQNGQLGLAKTQSGKWLASAPTITDQNGQYIASDPDGKAATVHLCKDKGPHVKWAFEFLGRFEPERREGSSHDKFWVGKSGFRFKMKLAEGPFQNWYVGVDALSPETQRDPEKVPAWRPLKLVQDPTKAAEFEYVDTEYRIGGG